MLIGRGKVFEAGRFKDSINGVPIYKYSGTQK